VVVKLLARPLPGQGIALPAFIPLIVTALAAHFLTLGFGGTLASAAPVGYISGTLGALIGADILNLRRVLRGSLIGASARPLPRASSEDADDMLDDAGSPRRQYVVSIGGAGMFDGIFLTSVLAPQLAVLEWRTLCLTFLYFQRDGLAQRKEAQARQQARRRERLLDLSASLGEV
jgi:Protein of unknown function (DUF1614)